ncbi:MAG: hypothetical protein A2X94_04865 [Bdellovibrionales bacterium GWB1_55_8]|nr:MAG: hypothetical protein A2X94_04865 [Bdellovibrionales bacterium GWB1_55_8]
MTWKFFEVTVSGKWVLAGEHAVLRGATAVALPLPDYSLKLTFRPSAENLRITPDSASDLLLDMISGILSRSGHEPAPPSGLLSIESTLPTGAGLGSSAALCVALTRWTGEALGIPESDWQEMARSLENRFHGQSSGMDVSTILAGTPITFSTARGSVPLNLKRLPRFTFHDTGLRANTSDCIAKVRELASRSPEIAARLDQGMREAAEMAREALIDFNQQGAPALKHLAESMRLAQESYAGWGLLPDAARKLQTRLLTEGALACKLTGAGGGGFLIALWPSD